jgi:hypothetical protein
MKGQTVLMFVLFIANRAASGLVNGSHYADKNTTAPLVLLFALSAGLLAIYGRQWQAAPIWRQTLAVAGAGLQTAALIGLYLSFTRPEWPLASIHFYTFAHQTILAATVLVLGWSAPVALALCCAVFPSVVLQKIFVNILPGNAWNYEGTNDPSGKTWEMFGLNIPRVASFNTLLTLSGLSVAAMVFSRHILAVFKNKTR